MRWRLESLFLLTLAGCHRREPAENTAPPLPVVTARVERGDVECQVTLRGLLAPPPGRDVRLGALAAGRIAELDVAEGDHVTKGQLLARLEPTPFRDAQAQAEAAVSQARAQAINANGRLARADLAFDAGVAAGQEVDDARAQRAAADSALRAAQAGLSTAANQLMRTELRAPFDGALVRVWAAAGEPVDGAGKPLIEVADTRSLELRGSMAPRAAGGIAVGARADVTVDALPGEVFQGEVVAVAPSVDPATGGVLVRIGLRNPDGRIKAGDAGSARIAGVATRGVLRIPESALFSRDDDQGSASAAERIGASGVVTRVPVEVGLTGQGWVEIKKGLVEGDSVVVAGGYGLPDGTRVQAADAGFPGKQ